MYESYKKQLVQRFWEERRLTHPHLTYLFDLYVSLCDNDMTKIPKELSVLAVTDSVHMPISDAESLYIRNITNSLMTDIDTEHGTFRLLDLDRAMKIWIQKISVLFSKEAQRYYYDLPLEDLEQ
jgi:hypothetical protein